MAGAGTVDLEARGADGTILRGRLWTPNEKPRRVLVAVHGLKDHGGRYEGLAVALGQRGIATAAFDLRGHGRSEGERAFVRRFAEYGSDLDNEWQTVAARFPGTPISLFGHSLGGAVAARFALDHPDLPSSLVLCAPAIRVPPTTSRAAVAGVRFFSAIAPHAHVFKPEIAGFSRDSAVLAAMAADPLIDQRPIPVRTAAELIRAMGTIHAHASRWTSPLLILHGTADRVTDPRGSAEFLAEVRSTSRRLIPVPGAFHDLFHEPEAVELRAATADFLAAPSGGA